MADAIRSGCTGPCNQGRARCSCVLSRITLTELDNEIPMHGDRPYPRSVPAPVVRPDPMRRRRLSKAAFTAVVALIGFGSLLLMFPRPVHSAALVVLVGPK